MWIQRRTVEREARGLYEITDRRFFVRGHVRGAAMRREAHYRHQIWIERQRGYGAPLRFVFGGG